MTNYCTMNPKYCLHLNAPYMQQRRLLAINVYTWHTLMLIRLSALLFLALLPQTWQSAAAFEGPHKTHNGALWRCSAVVYH